VRQGETAPVRRRVGVRSGAANTPPIIYRESSDSG
jgi:hypothetical protein